MFPTAGAQRHGYRMKMTNGRGNGVRVPDWRVGSGLYATGDRQIALTLPGRRITLEVRNEDLEKAVKPAFGFRLCPLEALGPIAEEDLDRSEWPELCRMTDHWSELALSDLPE